MAQSPNILVLTDGKMGDLTQCRGIAHALADKNNAIIHEHIITPKGFYAWPLPFIGIQPSDKKGKENSPFNAPVPNIIIASGRRSLPYLRYAKKLTPPAFTVFLKNPRYHHKDIDFIWAPRHDGLTGPHVLSTLTSPHNLTPERRKKALIAAQSRFEHITTSACSPCFGLILGGNSKSVTYSTDVIDNFIAQLLPLPSGCSVFIVPSRRTPPLLIKALAEALKPYRPWIWDGTGDNPYLQVLSYCERLIITGDSHNMVSEVLSLGKPVYVFRPPGLSKKLDYFLQALLKQKAIHDLNQGYDHRAYKLINATYEIAEEINQRYQNTMPQ